MKYAVLGDRTRRNERSIGKALMNPYHNLPPEQHATQRLVDQFNADERLWKELEPNRRARRKSRPRLSRKQSKTLDLLEFAKARPPQDCIGQQIQR